MSSISGFHFVHINIYKSDATKFIVTEKGLLPPFDTVHALASSGSGHGGKRKGRSSSHRGVFYVLHKLSKTHIEQLKALGASRAWRTPARSPCFKRRSPEISTPDPAAAASGVLFKKEWSVLTTGADTSWDSVCSKAKALCKKTHLVNH